MFKLSKRNVSFCDTYLKLKNSPDVTMITYSKGTRYAMAVETDSKALETRTPEIRIAEGFDRRLT